MQGMDLTPQTLREVEFREKLRGYHPDDVDDFLEEVATAVDELLARLRKAEAGGGAGALQTQAPEGGAITEETLRRTLLLAQRTADLAIADAQESARRIVDDAQHEAQSLKERAILDATATTEEIRRRSAGSIAELTDRQARLERNVAALEEWATQQRNLLRDALADQVHVLDVWLETSEETRPAAMPLPARPAELEAASEATAAVEPASRRSLEVVGGDRDAAPAVDLRDDEHHVDQHHVDEPHVDEHHVDEPGDSGDPDDVDPARQGGRLFRRH